jgi:hypothetical protein
MDRQNGNIPVLAVLLCLSEGKRGVGCPSWASVVCFSRPRNGDRPASNACFLGDLAGNQKPSLLDLRPGRQGHPVGERRRQGGLQRRYRTDPRDRSRRGAPDHRLRRAPQFRLACDRKGARSCRSSVHKAFDPGSCRFRRKSTIHPYSAGGSSSRAARAGAPPSLPSCVHCRPSCRYKVGLAFSGSQPGSAPPRTVNPPGKLIRA